MDKNFEVEIKNSLKLTETIYLLHDAFLDHYGNEIHNEDLKNINILCVKLVFCLYAQNIGIFEKDFFTNYLKQFDISKMHIELEKFFQILSTRKEDRDLSLDEKLKNLLYADNEFFACVVQIPQFNYKISHLLLEDLANNVDWSKINLTVFATILEDIFKLEYKENNQIYYTEVENIHKVIDPLFLEELYKEFENIKKLPLTKMRDDRLIGLQNYLSTLKFLDPACANGRFLIETYISIRKLENEIIKEYLKDKSNLDISPIKVAIRQFCGIEINEISAMVAKFVLWIAQFQILRQSEKIIEAKIKYSLKATLNIYIENALRIDWQKIIPKNELNYIISKPPCLGARKMNEYQKTDVLNVFGEKWKNIGNLDYVACWYKKAVDYMLNTKISAAFVSINSINKGEQVSLLWKLLFKKGININFANKALKWNEEINSKMQTDYMIIGFSFINFNKKRLFENDEERIVENINAYLLDSANIFVEAKDKPICNVAEISVGNKPLDNGNYLFLKDEMLDFIQKEPLSEKYFKPWYGAEEFINQKPRYCLWLGNCSFDELKRMPNCLKRVENVRNFRLNSKSEQTRNFAKIPTRFHIENMPTSHYIIIPNTTPKKRKYIPIGFLPSKYLASSAVHIIPGATLFHFAVLTSSVHMAWLKVLCVVQKTDYHYSGKIIYNNFPWCNPNVELKEKIENTAMKILDARALYPNKTFAQLYDIETMPKELKEAHRENDKLIMEAYGLKKVDKNTGMTYWPTESEVVAHLMGMYEKLARK